MYEALVKRLREHNGWALNETLDEAADAIEELQRAVKLLESDRDAERILRLAAEDKQWIPVEERLPESSGEYLVSGGGKVWICDFWRIAGVRGWCDSVNNPVVGYWMPLPPEPPKEEAYRDFKPITNYTRLVAKSPKELVEWINSVESDARYYGPKGKDVWLKWLQEVDE